MKYTGLVAMWNLKNSIALSASGGEVYISTRDTRACTRPKNGIYVYSLFNFILAIGTVMYHRKHKAKTSIPKVKSSLGIFKNLFDFDENLPDNEWKRWNL